MQNRSKSIDPVAKQIGMPLSTRKGKSKVKRKMKVAEEQLNESVVEE